MGNALAIRSSRESLFRIGPFSNGLMVLAVGLTFALQMLLLYVPFFQRVFVTRPLSARDLAISLLASAVVFAVIELYKLARRSFDRKRKRI